MGIYNVGDQVSIYEYKRGDMWSIRCIVCFDNITYRDLKKPMNASKELIQKFYEEAEIATLKKVEEKIDKRMSHD